MMNFLQGLWTGLSDGFKSLTMNYSPSEKQQIQQNGLQAQKNAQANEKMNGGTYSPITTITGMPASLDGVRGLMSGVKNELDWVIIGVVGLLLYNFIFKD